MNAINQKDYFYKSLQDFVSTLATLVSTADNQWTVKGFIDIFQNIYTVSSDTKIVSKILEIHLFPKILEFAQQHGYKVVLAEHQNYYPDISFVKADDETVKFAIDFKTTYRNPKKPHLCNGFTLGSHGEYFENRNSTKNIQFPYSSYLAHYCLGIIYDRNEKATIDETKIKSIGELQAITSVISNIQFFVSEKWKIASDKSGSGNTANIGSINNINDIINGRGMFSVLGEQWFDEYWINYRKIKSIDKNGHEKTISSLLEFVEYKGGDVSKILKKQNGAS